MSNSSGGFNFFIIILGFCLLGLPIILISLSTAPPTPEEYYSNVEWQYNESDSQSLTYLQHIASIDGNSSYWVMIKNSAPLDQLLNITKLIEQEENFTQYVNTDDYGGFSKKIHVFNATLVIENVEANITAHAERIYNNLYSPEEELTFMFYLGQLDEYESFYGTNITNAEKSMYDIIDWHSDLKYIVHISFNANIELNGVQQIAFAERLAILDTNGAPLFFVTNEYGWQPAS